VSTPRHGPPPAFPADGPPPALPSPRRDQPPEPVTWAVETTLFRGLAVLRVVVLLFAVAVNAIKIDRLDERGLVVGALVVMAIWTGFAAWWYDDPRRRTTAPFVAELILAIGLVQLTPLVHVPDHDLTTSATLPSFWVAAVVLGWGVRWGWLGGLAAAVLVSLADLSIRPEVTQYALGNVFLLMIGGPLVGWCTLELKRMAEARDRAERMAAAAAERQRLARVVHDGVLQVLALVQRRGAELGGGGEELGRLAGEQETALRALVQAYDGAEPVRHHVDLAARLAALASPSTTVSVPAGGVLVPGAVGQEVVAVVRACLDNTRTHVGDDAPSWILLEELPDAWVVTVRDAGPGIPEGRLEEAEAQGRLGVAASIRGRMRDLGGVARLTTAPDQGTEWELVVPRGASEEART